MSWETIEGLPVINTRRELVSLIAPTCQTVLSVNGFLSDIVGEGEILNVLYCTEIPFICHSFGVSKQCKMILML